VTYSYLANSPLVTNIWFTNNSTLRMTTTKAYDYLNRLTNIGSSSSSFSSSFDYVYNPASQRTSVTNVDGSYWVYNYDAMGQVTSGKKYWSDGTTVAGQQFDYSFDDIGNRQSTTRDTRTATYSANSLNQYSSRTVPGYVNVLGTATNTATVSLWSKDSTALYTPTTRKGDYFRGEMPFNNSTGAMWLTITNVAVLNDGTNPDIVTNVVGNLLLAKNSEAFTHDLDGNLTGDSLWTNVWNGENRRVVVESRPTLPAAAKRKVEWTILADGRWVERIVSTNNGTSYYPSQTNRYVWDNQILLSVLDHTNGVVVAFMRGLDLSGSIQGAGGVGGVLMVKAGSSAQCGAMANTTHFTCYDGNGNVAALVNAATGAESARYEDGPFAEQIRMTGPMAKLNPIRFSTQYHDD
jgi:YD repeat-containing protein